MIFEYSYLKPRHQFGKQCVFIYEHNIAEEHIYPNPELMKNYVTRLQKHSYTQTPSQFAAHEAQTIIKEKKNSGMLHMEGGWPREMHPADNEAVYRYRRRIERDDQYVFTMNRLLPPMQHYILQNNAVNIYTNFFDDMIPTELTMEYSIRIRNAYQDPQENVRPIRQLSWSPNGSNRLAAAYSFAEFDVHPINASPSSYVWDIENPNKALTALRSSSPLMALEFNPRDPSLLISGLMSGQVCSWDIRTSDKPVQISLSSVSHRLPVSGSLWVTSKANTEFFSSALDGTVKWWDTRFLKTPTEILVMDLNDPKRADILHAVGVTALQFEPTISSRFLAGMENGGIVNVSRRSNNLAEKLAMRFECYTGPAVAIDRNPAYPKNFLTIGDWSAKVWSDDTREGCFLSTCENNADLSGGCWSRSRFSVFFTINTEGSLDAYDILTGVQAPLTSIHVSSQSLTAISPHEDGEFLAVGSCDGNIYVLECTEGLTTFSKEDKAFLSGHFERCSKYEKVVENRVKEIILLRGSGDDEPPVGKRISERNKKMQARERGKRRTVLEERDNLKKSKRGKSRKRTALITSPEIITAEEDYFRIVKEYQEKMEEIDPDDAEAAQELLKQRTVMPPVQEEEKPEKTEPRTEGKSMRSKKTQDRARRMRRRQRSESKTVEQEPILDIDPELMKKRYSKKRTTRILQKSCTDVCKPEICCKDMEEKRKAKIQELMKKHKPEDLDEEIPQNKSVILYDKWYRRLTEYVDQIPDRSPVFKRKMLLLKELPPSVLRVELQEAKREIRAWQDLAIARKLSSWKIAAKLKLTLPEEPKIKFEEAPTELESETKVSQIEKRKQLRAKHLNKKPVRRGKKVKLTDEEIEKKEREERLKELWTTLKQKVKLFELRQKPTFPRISAAYPRRSSEDVTNSTTK